MLQTFPESQFICIADGHLVQKRFINDITERLPTHRTRKGPVGITIGDLGHDQIILIEFGHGREGFMRRRSELNALNAEQDPSNLNVIAMLMTLGISFTAFRELANETFYQYLKSKNYLF